MKEHEYSQGYDFVCFLLVISMIALNIYCIGSR